jgi:hypothetical protein
MSAAAQIDRADALLASEGEPLVERGRDFVRDQANRQV